MPGADEPRSDADRRADTEGQTRRSEGSRGRAEDASRLPAVTDPRGGSQDGGLTRATVRAALFEDAAPACIGKYRLGGEVGRGGLGVVYRATDPELGRQVAIKVLRTATPTDRVGRDGVAAEARALAALSHPNVVHVYETGEHEGRAYVAMEFVAGRTLAQWCRVRPRTWIEIVDIYVQAGRGLAAAHAAGLVHRDFKPDNVLVGDDGRPRVVDFGLARTAARPDLTEEDDIVGTPAYMPPEQVRGTQVDARSDQYSFCVALFEALYRQRPFASDSFEALCVAITEGAIRQPSERAGVPRRVQLIVERGLSPKRSDRFTDMDALLEALVDATERGPRRRRRLAIALGVIGSAAVAAALVHDWRDEAPAPAGLEAWTPTLRQLTKMRAPGAVFAIDGQGQRLAYVNPGGAWTRDVTGGAPQPLTLSFDAVGQLAFAGTDLWLTDASSLWKVSTDGPALRVADGLVPGVFLDVVADGRAAGASERLVWRWSPDAQRVRRWPLLEHPTGLALSSDGQLLALRTWSRGTEHETLRIFETDDQSWTTLEIDASPHEGLAWSADGHFVTLGAVPEGLVVHCFSVDRARRQIGPVVRTSAPVAVGSGLARGTSTTAAGDMLIMISEATRDVFVGDLGATTIEDLLPLAPEVDAGSSDPTWVDDQHLAYVSRLHLRPSVLTQELASGTVSAPLALDGEIVSYVALAAEHQLVVTQTPERTTRLHERIDGRLQAITDPFDDVPIAAVRCAEAWCAVLRRPEGRPRLDIFDRKTKAFTRGADCPDTALCAAERFFAADDGRVLVPSVRQDRLLWMQPTTGAVTDAPYRIPTGASVQSAIVQRSAGVVIATLLFNDPGPDGTYVIARLSADGAVDPMWGSDDTWVVNPQVSPDGRRIAVSGLRVQADAALLAGALAGCPGQRRGEHRVVVP